MMYFVDGTSDDLFFRTEAEYSLDFATSFCTTHHQQMRTSSRYFAGPKVFGLETASLAKTVAKLISDLAANEKVFLCGYSRGGAAVIEAARLVSPRPIAALFLFDAVNRAVLLETDVIPANVAYAYHAVRDAAFARKFEQEVQASEAEFGHQLTHMNTKLELPTLRAAVNMVATRTRDLKFKYLRHRYTLFDNTGLKAAPPCRLVVKSFEATHGAMGGMPWDDVSGDLAASRAVGTWMASFMTEHGASGK